MTLPRPVASYASSEAESALPRYPQKCVVLPKRGRCCDSHNPAPRCDWRSCEVMGAGKNGSPRPRPVSPKMLGAFTKWRCWTGEDSGLSRCGYRRSGAGPAMAPAAMSTKITMRGGIVFVPDLVTARAAAKHALPEPARGRCAHFISVA